MKRKDESGKDQKRGGNSFCKKKEEEERKEERRYHAKDENAEGTKADPVWMTMEKKGNKIEDGSMRGISIKNIFIKNMSS